MFVAEPHLDCRRAHRGCVCGVHDGVMYEHDIELTRQAQGSHVADEVLAAGVKRLTDGQHPGGTVGQREVEVCFQMRGQASASTSELQQCRPTWCGYGWQSPQEIIRFLGIVLWRRKERPPFGELVVEARPWLSHRAALFARSDPDHEPPSPRRHGVSFAAPISMRIAAVFVGAPTCAARRQGCVKSSGAILAPRVRSA